jgi:methyl-accepting chemotaxis protein PixJ
MAPQELSSRELSTFEQSLKELRQQITGVAEQMRSAKTPEDLLKMAVIQIRQSLQVDRVLMLRFLEPGIDRLISPSIPAALMPASEGQSVASYLYSSRNTRGVGFGHGNGNGNGKGELSPADLSATNSDEFADYTGLVVAESLARGWTPTQGATIHLTGFGFDTPEDYVIHPFVSIADTERTNLTPYQRQILERYQVKASLNIPICLGKTFWGLISVQQCDRSYQWAEREIVFLRQVVTEMAVLMQQFDLDRAVIDSQAKVEAALTDLRDALGRGQERDASVSRVIERVRQSLNIDEIFATTTREVRMLLECDRVSVYKFKPDFSGQFVAESVAPGWVELVGPNVQRVWKDTYLEENQGGRYAEHETYAVADIYTEGHDPCHIELLEQFEARAYMLVPMFQGETLWGILAAYQNGGPRQWEQAEVTLLQRIADQLSIALQQAETVRQMQLQSKRVEKAAERDKTFAQVMSRIRQSLEIDEIFNTTTREVRSLLHCDRVSVYKFNPDFSGEFVAESVTEGWGALVGPNVQRVWKDTYLEENQGGRYALRETYAVSDIYTEGHDPCHVELLEQFEARAYMLVPIFQGDHLWGILAAYQNNGPRDWEEDEVRLLARIADQLGVALKQAETLAQVQLQSQRVEKAADRDKTFAQVMSRIRQSLDLDEIFNTTTREVRALLKCDRVSVYKFNPDFSGEFVAESVAKGWGALVGPNVQRVWKDTYLEENQGGRYALRDTYAVSDIYTEGHDPCHVELLEQFEARAYMLVPIFQGDHLWGILAAYQNSGPRDWEEAEVNLLARIGDQLGVGLKQAETLGRLRSQSERIEQAAVRDRAVGQVIARIRESFDIETIFATTTREVRALLKCDRVSVYKFNPDFSGEFVAESVADGWVKLVGENVQRVWKDTYLEENQGGRYALRETYAVSDIYTEGHDPCHVELLEQFEARAYTLVPIFQGSELWGILAAYQNDKPRDWDDDEVGLLVRISDQLGVALQQAETLAQLREQSERIEKTAAQDRAIDQVIGRIRQSFDVDNIFNTTTQEVRQLLKCDRVSVYKFNPDFSGEFVAESVAQGWGKLVGPNVKRVWKDTYLEENQGGRYALRETYAVSDIYTEGHDPCHVELLEQFEARAYTLVPIFQGSELWGILAAYQNDGPRDWEDNEVSLLVRISDQLGIALQQAETLEQLRQQSAKLEKAAIRDRAVTQVIDRIRRTLDVETIFDTTTKEVRTLLKCDRVGVYRFNADWSGAFVAESVGATWVSLVARQQELPALQRNVSDCQSLKPLIDASTYVEPQVGDTYLQETEGGRFAEKQTFSVSDIHTAGFTPCYLEILEQYQCRAYAIVPIFQGDRLWGLLAAYQNDGPRQWEDAEVQLLAQIGVQLGVAIQQGQYLKKVEEQATQLEAAAQRDKAAKEELQRKALELLMAVRPALDGDLTVRAPVTEDELGTLADSYNNTLQSLRRIVVQVQGAVAKVVNTSESSDASLIELSSQAQKQVEEITNALSQIQQMVSFTEETAKNALQVETAIETANKTLQSGDEAMNRTVDGIMDIRKTVTEAAKSIKRLTQSSQDIAKVVNLINNFATQTNLLALNAAIEATRAGEYGRGFAVVADEVRSLARQSGDATTEIEKLVQEIQEETKEVTLAMQMASEQVTRGTTLVGETRETLNDIVAATGQIAGLVEGISAATREQTRQAQSVTNLMTEVAAIADRTSDNSIEISQSFKDALTTVQELQASAGQFKVD